MTAAGYIAFDKHGIIHGTGATADAARTDAFKRVGQGASSLTTMPAAHKLLSIVNARGGGVEWCRSMDDIACCPNEAEAEENVENEENAHGEDE